LSKRTRIRWWTERFIGAVALEALIGSPRWNTLIVSYHWGITHPTPHKYIERKHDEGRATPKLHYCIWTNNWPSSQMPQLMTVIGPSSQHNSALCYECPILLTLTLTLNKNLKDPSFHNYLRLRILDLSSCWGLKSFRFEALTTPTQIP